LGGVEHLLRGEAARVTHAVAARRVEPLLSGEGGRKGKSRGGREEVSSTGEKKHSWQSALVPVPCPCLSAETPVFDANVSAP